MDKAGELEARWRGHVDAWRAAYAGILPADFLAGKAGDCDDFATLAAEVLRGKGYTTRLVVVHMEREVHVVCYVNEIKGYLDYNRRHEAHPVVACALQPRRSSQSTQSTSWSSI